MSDDDFELDLPPEQPTELTESPVSSTSSSPVLTPPTTVEYLPSEREVDTNISISTSQEATRAKIAWVFTQLFLLLVVIALVLPSFVHLVSPEIFADPLETTKQLVTLIASVLAGPFGFIVGFYFKERDNG